MSIHQFINTPLTEVSVLQSSQLDPFGSPDQTIASSFKGLVRRLTSRERISMGREVSDVSLVVFTDLPNSTTEKNVLRIDGEDYGVTSVIPFPSEGILRIETQRQQ